jgi:hypothetical protein
MKILAWVVFGLFAISIGLYPIVYLLTDMTQEGLLSSKSPHLLGQDLYMPTFYLHISFGGIALLTGWTQFSKRLRNRNLTVHRWLGKTYVIVVLISGLAGFHIAMYATGGITSSLGFLGLAIAWLFTTIRAFQFIQRKQIDLHQQWMIRSYALTFAAVTLRIWIPLFQIVGMEFLFAYRIIAWFCWVPNLVVAELIVHSLKKGKRLQTSN